MNPASAAAVVVALAMLWFARRSRREFLSLPEIEPALQGPAGSVTVVVPARNEASNITRLLRSLRETPVVVVDDQSDDGTPELARAAGAEVISAGPLPPGWLGKPHACWLGARHSDSDWLLFVDADTWYEPGFVPALVSWAERSGMEAVSCFPRQEFGSWWEQAVLPYALGLYFCGVSARRINRGAGAQSLANGQCLLVRRLVYEAVGGHAAVRDSIIEDVALAQVLQKHGAKLAVARAERWAHVRMYETFTALWRGFEKNSFRFLLANPTTGAQVISASVVMTSWFPILVWLAIGGCWATAACLAFIPGVAWRPWYYSWRGALLAPVAIYIFQMIALHGMLKTLLGLSTDWKGRQVG